MTESDTDDLIPETAADIARRTLALIGIVDRAHNENPEQPGDWVAKHSIADYFADAELTFYADATQSSDAITNFSWRAEAMVPLLWSIWQLQDMPRA